MVPRKRRTLSHLGCEIFTIVDELTTIAASPDAVMVPEKHKTRGGPSPRIDLAQLRPPGHALCCPWRAIFESGSHGLEKIRAWSASMIRWIPAVILALSISSSTFATERTVTLTVQKMVCDYCTATVKKSLEALPGVARATVSLEQHTAVVTYDDDKVDVKSLIEATTRAGYPSAPGN
jgi:periplasmic mercuric ion binding protein